MRAIILNEPVNRPMGGGMTGGQVITFDLVQALGEQRAREVFGDTAALAALAYTLLHYNLFLGAIRFLYTLGACELTAYRYQMGVAIRDRAYLPEEGGAW